VRLQHVDLEGKALFKGYHFNFFCQTQLKVIPIESDRPSSFMKTWGPSDFQHVFCSKSPVIMVATVIIVGPSYDSLMCDAP